MPTINSGFSLGIITLNFYSCTVHELLYQLSKYIHSPLPSAGLFAAQIGLPATIVVYSMGAAIRIRHLTSHLFLSMDPHFRQIRSIRIMNDAKASCFNTDVLLNPFYYD
jgi:hypothetical protein